MDGLCLKISKMMPFEMFRRESLVGSEQEQHFSYKYSQAFLKSKYHINLKKYCWQVLSEHNSTAPYRNTQEALPLCSPSTAKVVTGDEEDDRHHLLHPPRRLLLHILLWFDLGDDIGRAGGLDLPFFVLSWRRFWMSVMCFWITKMTILFKVVLGRQRAFLKNKKVFKRMLSLPDGGKKLNWERKVKFETLKVAATPLLRKNCTKT